MAIDTTEIIAEAAYLVVALKGVEIREKRFPVQVQEVIDSLAELTALLDAGGFLNDYKQSGEIIPIWPDAFSAMTPIQRLFLSSQGQAPAQEGNVHWLKR
jgi:hypothetical protein